MPGGNGLWFWTYTLSLALSTSAIYLSPAFTIWSFSAKSPKIFRWQAMVVWVVLIGIVYYILSPIIGMGGRILFPDLVKTDTLTPLIMTKLMPIWMYVIVGIGLLAAMNSTAAGYMITSGVIVSQDIYKDKFRPNATDRECIWSPGSSSSPSCSSPSGSPRSGRCTWSSWGTWGRLRDPARPRPHRGSLLEAGNGQGRHVRHPRGADRGLPDLRRLEIPPAHPLRHVGSIGKPGRLLLLRVHSDPPSRRTATSTTRFCGRAWRHTRRKRRPWPNNVAATPGSAGSG